MSCINCDYLNNVNGRLFCDLHDDIVSDPNELCVNFEQKMNETEFYGAENDAIEKDRIRGNAEFCMEEHKKAFENWTQGNIVDCWEDENGNTCVKYDSGNWWHYKLVYYGDDLAVSEWW